MNQPHFPYYNMPNTCSCQYRPTFSDAPTGYPASGTTGTPASGLIPPMGQGQMGQGQQFMPGATLPQISTPKGNPLAPISPGNQPPPMTAESLEYMNGFLRTQIGKRVKVDFLIGTGTLIDKFGTLLAVGANYILIRQAETDDEVLCDFFTIKFITFYY